MAKLRYRQSRSNDIPAMAEIRAQDWGSEEYWRERIRQYVALEVSPREALQARVLFVCVEGQRVVGLIAGHLTRRFGCDGELEWISVRQQYRNRGIASQLLRRLAKWFMTQNARRICVDVQPSNKVARRFYAEKGAESLRPHWMVWEDIGRAA